MRSKSSKVWYSSWMLFLILLIALGLFAMVSAELALAIKGSGDIQRALFKVLLKLSISFAIFLLFSIVNYKVHKNLVPFYYVLSIALLSVVYLFPPVLSTQGDKFYRWMKIGSFDFQPSEVVKIFLIITIAHYIESKKEKISSFKEGVLMPLLISTPVIGLIFFEPDLSTSLILFSVVILMVYTKGAKLSHILLITLILLLIFFTLGFIGGFKKYQFSRLKAFFERNTHQQVRMAEESLRSGGLMGKGIGMGNMKFLVPVFGSDFIFALIGEEMGYLGIIAVLLSYIGLVGSFLFIVEKIINDDFAKSFIEGFSYLIIIQVMVNLGVNVGILPVTGVTLPFVSQGGSSFMAFMMGMGIIVNIYYLEGGK